MVKRKMSLLDSDMFGHDPIVAELNSHDARFIFRFDNNYGASVVCNLMSYGNKTGLFELAVIRFSSDDQQYEIVYDTPITSDVIGYLAPNQVNLILTRIKDLSF